MQRHALFLCFLFFFSVIVTACGVTPNINYLSYQSYPFEAEGVLVYDGTEYGVTVRAEREGQLTLAFCSPARIKGLELSLADGEVSFGYDGRTVTWEDGGYALKEGILLSSRLFSISFRSYASSEVKTVGGVRYQVVRYQVEEGDIAVYFQEKLTTPERIEATLNGHRFEFRFVNEG